MLYVCSSPVFRDRHTVATACNFAGNEKLYLDLKNGSGSTKRGDGGKADVTITMKEEDFLAMAAGKLDGMQACLDSACVGFLSRKSIHQAGTFRRGWHRCPFPAWSVGKQSSCSVLDGLDTAVAEPYFRQRKSVSVSAHLS